MKWIFFRFHLKLVLHEGGHLHFREVAKLHEKTNITSIWKKSPSKWKPSVKTKTNVRGRGSQRRPRLQLVRPKQGRLWRDIYWKRQKTGDIYCWINHSRFVLKCLQQNNISDLQSCGFRTALGGQKYVSDADCLYTTFERELEFITLSAKAPLYRHGVICRHCFL